MANISDDDMMRVIARLRVVEQFLATLLRDLAPERGLTPEDVQAYAERARRHVEKEGVGIREIYFNAAADRFLDQIISDMKEAQGKKD